MLEVFFIDEFFSDYNLCHCVEEIHVITRYELQVQVSVSRCRIIARVCNNNLHLVGINTFPVYDTPEKHGMVLGHI